MNEIQEMKEELEKIKEFLEKTEVPAYVISMYNIAARAVELAYNISVKQNQTNN